MTTGGEFWMTLDTLCALCDLTPFLSLLFAATGTYNLYFDKKKGGLRENNWRYGNVN